MRLENFQTTCVIETGLSDFHLMTLTVMRKSFKKLKPRVIDYRSYKHFSNEVFRESLLEKLSQQTFVNNDYGFEIFFNISLKTLNKHAPSKTKHTRGIRCPSWQRIFLKILWKDHGFVTNTLKIIMKKIGNYIPNKKNKKAFYENLDERRVFDSTFLENSKAFTIRKIQCQRKDKFEWKWWICENWKLDSWGF